MRITKFRGWNTKHKKRIYGDLFRSRGERFITQDGIVSNPLAEPEDWRVEPESVGQFTGLLDKNGKEIYEGDIVKRDDKSNGRYWRFAVVELDPDIQFNCSSINEVDGIKNSSDYTFRYGQFTYKDTENYLTIIGNIHENPELINR